MRELTHYLSLKSAWLAAAVALAAVVPAVHADDLVPLQIKLPAPAFLGTPSDTPVGSNVEKPSGKPRPPLMVPPGVVNVALGKKVTSSSTNTPADRLVKITDGEKESSDENAAQLRRGVQWIQIDLGAPTDLYAILIWHTFDTPKVYHGVVVEIADDADFTKNVRTLFNNDRENADKQGVGTNREYFESNEGKLVEAKGEKASFVRIYSDGSTESHLNEYTEVEVYGRPAK